MSAISGIFLRDGREADLKLIKKMNNSLNHRGADGSDVIIEGSVAFGHQMLFTTPESLNEKLPYEEDGLIITADARIDNRRELSEKLGILDTEEISDSYFILKAYQKWGEKCPERLLGDFAFAIWDREKERLFCARDHMGIKSFYYSISDDLFLFSSEAKAILEFLDFKLDLNEKMIAKQLSGFYNDLENWFYKGIYRLPPACNMIITSENIKKEKYWNLNPNYKFKLKTEEEYKDKFIEIFSESVECRLRTTFPIGCHLSGGLDSSSVVSMAVKLLKEENENYNLNTYTLVHGESENIEDTYIKSVLENTQINPQYIDADKISVLTDIEQVIKHSDSPRLNPNNYVSWSIYSKANQDEVRIILNGIFGDTVLGMPAPYLTELFRSFHWVRLYKELGLIKKGYQIGYFEGLKKYIIWPLIPTYFKNILKRFRGKSKQKNLLKKDFTIKTNIFNDAEKFKKEYQKSKKTVDGLHYYALTQGFIPYRAELQYNFSGAFSIEMRYPFLDKRLVEFCYSLPSEMKIKGGWDRYIMRRSLVNIVPDKILTRTDKSDYSNTMHKNTLKFEKNTIENMILNNQDILEEYVDTDEILKLYDEYKKGNLDNILKIWDVIIFAFWMNNQKLK